ncbi:hypothetical protein GCM10009799_22280 [Nocardiopsis rhodophaea]|uniref:Uncharacterized protein n=1 Tax=Nocardiopsis rhodophaea TaxID=280238 RepID=A0ABN2SZL9_9ACTN
MTPTATLASMTSMAPAAYSGRFPMVTAMSSEPEPLITGMIIIVMELVAGGLSGNCGGAAMTRGSEPGSGTECRAGRWTSVVAKAISPVHLGKEEWEVATVMIPQPGGIA